MQVTIAVKDLTGVLKPHQDVLDGRSEVVTGHIGISTDGSQLKLVSTNMELWVTSRTDAVQVSKQGGCAIPGAVLSKIIATLPGDTQLQLTAGESNHVVVSWNKSHTKLYGIGMDQFPDQPKMNPAFSFMLPAVSACRVFGKAAFATDDIRPLLTGIHLRYDGTDLIAISCNGILLSVYREEVKIEGEHTGVTIPKLAAKLIAQSSQQFDGTVSFAVSANSLVAEIGSIKIATSLLGGTYPTQVLDFVPQEYQCEAVVSREELKHCIKRIAALYHNKLPKAVGLCASDGIVSCTSIGASRGDIEDYCSASPVVGNARVFFDLDLLNKIVDAVDSERIVLQLNEVCEADQKRPPMSRIIPLGFPGMKEKAGYEFFGGIMPVRPPV